jgi:hypothetical protein
VEFPDEGRFGETPQLKISSMPGEEYSQMTIEATQLENITVEVKLRGNSTKESDKKSFNIKFSEEVALFGMDSSKKWCVIGQPFDKSLLRTVIGFDYADQLGIAYVPQSRLCNVWIDDTYMGVYAVTSPVEVEDAQFVLERNLDRVEDDKVYVESLSEMRFEFNEPETPDAKQVRECQDMLEDVELAVSTLDHDKYDSLIDVDSFVNFYIFNEMIKDVDFGEYSTRYYFMDGVLFAGPPWDLDLTQGNVSEIKEEAKYVEYQNQQLWCDTKDFYYWLCRDPWFMQKVHERWNEVRVLSKNLSDELVNRYVDAHITSLEANYESKANGGAGWDVTIAEHSTENQSPADSYIGNVELLKKWLEDRFKYLDKEWK